MLMVMIVTILVALIANYSLQLARQHLCGQRRDKTVHQPQRSGQLAASVHIGF